MFRKTNINLKDGCIIVVYIQIISMQTKSSANNLAGLHSNAQHWSKSNIQHHSTINHHVVAKRWVNRQHAHTPAINMDYRQQSRSRHVNWMKRAWRRRRRRRGGCLGRAGIMRSPCVCRLPHGLVNLEIGDSQSCHWTPNSKEGQGGVERWQGGIRYLGECIPRYSICLV
jgi:hypothetical protein